VTHRPLGDESASGSFRDPSGHVFVRGGQLYRQINRCYAADYDHLIASGLYRALVEQRLLVAHEEVDAPPEVSSDACRVIQPERIPFISYPFEWSFGQLKQAALTTLRLQRQAVAHDMVLKDASAYNVQFKGVTAIFIDTLSFETWREGTPWVAYRQFCQHFLGPLALMSVTEVRLGQLSRLFIDGVPLDLVSRLLPWRSRLRPSLLMHVHLHARAQARHGRATVGGPSTAFSRRAMLGLVDHLESAVDSLTDRDARGPWVDYYDHNHNYSPDAMANKHRLVSALLQRVRPATVWDLGANTGAFSRLASEQGAYTIAFDGDSAAVDRHFDDCRARGEINILPLVMDLANPSSGIGWSHAERLSLLDRGPADVVLALGLVHHLRIANHVPFAMVAEFFHRVGRTLIVEFPLPSDSQVRSMLERQPALREGYSLQAFESEFARHFEVDAVHGIAGAERRLYLMRARSGASS
jgi:hypothetical protein